MTKYPVPKPPLNPFYSRLKVSSWDWIKMIVLLPVVIVRVIGIAFFMLLAVVLTYIGLAFLPFEEMSTAPLSWWRRCIRSIISHVFLRGAFFFSGFHWVKTYGHIASRSEAPIFVVAPHSAYFDPFCVTQFREVSVVAKEATRHEPVTGRILDFSQPIYVNREDAGSRHGAANKLLERVTSTLDFPQIFIFPEGTTTNRSCLVQFKPGAFRCRKPVQPVLIRYPNRFDTLTWTWDSPSLRKTMFYTLSQLHNRMEMEFLPVYHPTNDEMDDPSLYAANVEALMSNALGLPTTTFTLDDGKAMERLCKTKVRRKLELIWNIKGRKDELFESAVILKDVFFTQSNVDWDSKLPKFTSTVSTDQIPDEKTLEKISTLFDLFKQSETQSSIDLRPYCFLELIMFASPDVPTFQNIARLVFRAYAGKDATNVSRDVYGIIVKQLFEEKEENIDAQFYSPRSNSQVSVISYTDFYDKIIRRIEYVKLYAMDVTGQIPGDYPSVDARDHPRVRRHAHFSRTHNT